MKRFGDRIGRLATWWALALAIFTLAACRSELAEVPAPTAEPAQAGAPVVAAVAASSPVAQARPPVRLQIPAIDLDVPVEAMGWEVIATEEGKRTNWVVPDAAAGWHVNSAGAGGQGNVVLSGHQVVGDAVFAPLSLGDVAVGQDVLLTDEEGVTFLYRITQVTDPMPVAGASEADQALAALYIGPTETARLTLVTGWPDFTTTHRIFALADLIGVAQ